MELILFKSHLKLVLVPYPLDQQRTNDTRYIHINTPYILSRLIANCLLDKASPVLFPLGQTKESGKIHEDCLADKMQHFKPIIIIHVIIIDSRDNKNIVSAIFNLALNLCSTLGILYINITKM